MIWESLQVKDLSKAIQFIGEKEWVCEHLFTRLLKKQRQKCIAPDHVWISYENGSPAGILYLSNQGLLLPYLPFLDAKSNLSMATEDYLEDLDSLKRLLFPKTIRIYSIVGKLLFVQAMEELFGFNEGVSVDYHLMTRSQADPLPPLPNLPSLHIRKATRDDIERILPLQILYEKEEVLIRPDLMDPAKTRKDLDLALREQIILLGEIEGKAVTKAGTNAQGLLYHQIGGVFTDPNYRGRHFARALMIRLLQQIHGEGKNACLFVKTQNKTAIHLYEELGFQIREAFRIHYV
ncbi:MAG: GNAT family N-acetyltransferase [Spirochaetes bacterium]|nr:GNAT family N-acetyltransferase [Spirochaetota bacterium]